MPPRVMLLTPFAFSSHSRKRRHDLPDSKGARRAGCRAPCPRPPSRIGTAIEAEADAFRPSLIHAFHAYRVGPVALGLARRADIPLVVTVTGTDANHDLFDLDSAPIVRQVLENASRLTVFHASIAERMAEARLDRAGRLVVVPQSASLEPTEPFDLGLAGISRRRGYSSSFPGDYDR